MTEVAAPRLSFFLPVALSGTGRPGSDLDRAAILLETWGRFFDTGGLGDFLIASPAGDVPRVAERVRQLVGDVATVVAETELAPELADDPPTFHGFPSQNKGWMRQQVLKLAAASHLAGEFYMTLDSDVVFTNRFGAQTLIRGGRGRVNTQTMADYATVFTPEAALASIEERRNRNRRSAALLGLPAAGQEPERFFGETPVVLNRSIVHALCRRLEEAHGRGWRSLLLESGGWTEYSLYFTFAEAEGSLETFHEPGGFDSVLRMTDSLWYEPGWYLDGRTVETWRPLAHADSPDGVAVVAQSYLGTAVQDVERVVTTSLGPRPLPAHGRGVRRDEPAAGPIGLIVSYHRIVPRALDLWGMRVRPETFSAHLSALRQFGTPVSLPDLVRSHREGRAPRRSIVVTFDDGYVDNLTTAWPMLREQRVPATVFVTTGRSRWPGFWWDHLEQVLLRPNELPGRLCLRFGDGIHEWTLGGSARYTQEEYERDCVSCVWEGEPGSRIRLYHEVYARLWPLPDEQRRSLLDELRTQAGLAPDAFPEDRPLTAPEIARLGGDSLVTIGAHTVTHPPLSSRPEHVQREEIRQSRDLLEKTLGTKVTTFAYPHGKYTDATVELLRQAGFEGACTTREAAVRADDDPLLLPRVTARDWSGEELLDRLRVWFDGSTPGSAAK